MSKTLQTRIQLKHDIESNWITAGNNSNFIPLAGEIIIYDDLQKIKIGDGQKNINELDFMTINPTEFDNLDTAKMDKENPTGTGSFSLNRVADSEIGIYSFAEGMAATASGAGSHAEGMSTTASGMASHAEGGWATTASGTYSHAEGYGTTASGDMSHSEGERTIASSDGSHAEGSGTTASSNYQHVQGKYNIDDPNDKYAHIVGNGNYVPYTDVTTYSNAHTLDWDGNGWFAGDVYVGSTSGTDKDSGSKKLATEEYVNNVATTFTVVGTTLVVGNAATIPAAENYSF